MNKKICIIFRIRKYNHFWRGVAEYPNYHIMIKNRKIILNNNLFCQNCKSVRATEIHHIDKSKDNHSLNNLMAICRSCHMKLSKRNKKIDKLDEIDYQYPPHLRRVILKNAYTKNSLIRL